MKILGLKLENFCGISGIAVDFDGRNAVVYGENGTGKTTLCDAYQWLFTNKDSELSADFNIKRIDKSGNEAHKTDHVVSGFFEIDGIQFRLKKTYHEIWTKKRGSSEPEMTGHTTDYEFDGVPCTKKEYDAKVNDKIKNAEVFLMLTNPVYFSDILPWEKRREIIIDIIGDISDEDVFNYNVELLPLKDVLKDRTFEEYKKVIKANSKKINKKLKEIPVRMSEQERNLIDVSGIDIEAEKSKIEDLKKQISEKEKEISRIENGDEIQNLNAEIKVIELKMFDIKSAATKVNQIKIENQSNIVESLKFDLDEAEAVLNVAKKQASDSEKQISEKQAKLDECRKVWIIINSEQFEEKEPPKICECCGKPYSENERAEIRLNAKSEFNLKKAIALEANAEAGKSISNELQKLKESFKSKIGNVEGFMAGMKNAKEKYDNAFKDFQALKEYKFEPDSEYLKFQNDIDEFELKKDRIAKDIDPEIKRIKSEIAEIEGMKTVPNENIQKINDNKKAKKRINDLEIELKEASAQFEKYENELFMMDEFTRVKVELAEKKIDKNFDVARFKMFDMQINGGLKDTCQTTFNGLPFSSCSGGEKIIVGLDIIKTLQKHYDFYPPIFIDQAGEITKRFDIDCQVVRFVASVDDKEFRFEIQ